MYGVAGVLTGTDGALSHADEPPEAAHPVACAHEEKDDLADAHERRVESGSERIITSEPEPTEGTHHAYGNATMKSNANLVLR